VEFDYDHPMVPGVSTTPVLTTSTESKNQETNDQIALAEPLGADPVAQRLHELAGKPELLQIREAGVYGC
jgi:hypothetical protein